MSDLAALITKIDDLGRRITSLEDKILRSLELSNVTAAHVLECEGESTIPRKYIELEKVKIQFVSSKLVLGSTDFIGPLLDMGDLPALQNPDIVLIRLKSRRLYNKIALKIDDKEIVLGSRIFVVGAQRDGVVMCAEGVVSEKKGDSEVTGTNKCGPGWSGCPGLSSGHRLRLILTDDADSLENKKSRPGRPAKEGATEGIYDFLTDSKNFVNFYAEKKIKESRKKTTTSSSAAAAAAAAAVTDTDVPHVAFKSNEDAASALRSYAATGNPSQKGAAAEALKVLTNDDSPAVGDLQERAVSVLYLSSHRKAMYAEGKRAASGFINANVIFKILARHGIAIQKITVSGGKMPSKRPAKKIVEFEEKK